MAGKYEKYDKFISVYERIKKSFKRLSCVATITKEDIFKKARNLGIVEPYEEKLLFDELEKYFLKFKIRLCTS